MVVLHAARGSPFQQPFLRDPYAPIGAYDRVQAEVGFVGQTGKRQYCPLEMPERRAQCSGEMLAGKNVIRLAYQVEN